MEESMKLLIDLQACDREMGDLQGKITEGPLKMKELEEKLARMNEEYQTTEQQLEDLKHEKRGIDQDIEAIESQITKANTKLSNIKSNKEYKAALKEIDDLTREKEKLEDKAIEFMEQIDSLSDIIEDRKKDHERFHEEVNHEKEDITRDMKTWEKTLLTLQEKRGEFCEKVNVDLLRKYDFIRERKAGRALSPVFNGVCDACHIELPPQRYNELIRGERLLDCPNCHRIIYWGDNAQFKEEEAEGEA